MKRVFSLRLAQQTAEAFLKEEGILTLPVDPFAIARSRDIAVEGKPESVGGVSGMLLRHGNNFGIVYATHISSPGFQRFSVSHELGHYFLPGHVDQVIKDGLHVSRAGFVTNDPYELEADHFAAGLLMPETPFRAVMDRLDPGLDAIDEMSRLCVTSRTATAIRVAELSRDAVAVIVSTGGVIDYCFMSDTMKSLPDIDWLRKGKPLPVGTAAAQLAGDADKIAAGARVAIEVDVREWLGGSSRATVTEETVGLGAYGRVLTVLTSDTIRREDEVYDDEPDEERLIESWTPRFRHRR